MGVILHWLMLFGFWLLLSGMFDAFHVGAGLLCTAAVALLSRHLQAIDLGVATRATRHLATVPWLRLGRYFVWLLREIAIANWQVVRLVLDPKLPIDPAVVRFRTRLHTDLAKTIFANSITLTPGTITVDVVDGEFVVHALAAQEPLVGGLREMERRVHAALPGIEPAPLALT
jgi:multicomponent Na+:H+ antiporter subunit E